MNLFSTVDSPFLPIISFESVILDWEKQLTQFPDDTFSRNLLEKVAEIPELRTGFSDFSILETHKELISELLSCVFPKMLTDTEISAATFPWCNTIINPSHKFQELINESKKEFCINNGIFDKDSFYIASCSFILNRHYQIPVSDIFPLYFQFRDDKGINKHYRIIYNPEFLEVIPTENAKELSVDEIDELLENLDNVELWKEKIPPNTWTLKGFGIMNMFDNTVETAFANLKQRLTNTTLLKDVDADSEHDLLKSIFNVGSIEAGISNYDFKTNKITLGFYNMLTNSLLMENVHSRKTGLSLENSKLKTHIENNKPLIVSNISNYLERYPNDEALNQIHQLGYESCALIPLQKDANFLGVAELVSKKPMAFNSLTIYRINMIYSFLVDRLERGFTEFSNLKNSIIQKEYTRLHPSVAWKFEKEVENYLKSTKDDYVFKEIVFQDVVALYGEVDIKGSSDTQNQCIQSDFEAQVKLLTKVVDALYAKTKIELLSQKKFELKQLIDKLKNSFETSTEAEVQHYISKEIHPILSNPSIYQGEEGIVADYLKKLDPYTGRYYHARKDFDDSVSCINKNLTQILDERQKEIQKVFPHFFERFKTDGVDHTIYIGSSISIHKVYDPIFLQNLRLWQLQVTCEMMNEHVRIQSSLPIPLEVTSLILVFNQPISIRFRMDEKRFDVDGSYNAKYEVVKKRIDKSFIKGTDERLTQAGKLAVVYSQFNEEKEYLRYFHFLQGKGLLKEDIEFLQLEDFQGITGLRALRVEISEVEKSKEIQPYFSIQELKKEVSH